jgi:hypothetical protein
VEVSPVMRQIINSTYISLDGVIEGPHLWTSVILRYASAS